MIPLTRSRLNRYNSGAIDLSDSYQQNGNSSSSSNGSGSSSNMTVRATAWNAPSTSGNAVQSYQPQSLRITSSSSPLDKPPQNQVQNYHNHHHGHTTSFRAETSRKRKISHEEMEVVVEEQQYQPRKRDSHTLTGSGQMRESIDSHMDDSYVNRPSTQSKFTPQTAPSTKPTRQSDPASWPQSTSTPSGPPTLFSIELSSRPSSAKSPPPSSLLSSKDYASQDESGDHQSENTSSGDDDEEDEDEESDEDGGSDKDEKPKKDKEQHRDEELDKDGESDENGQSDEDQMRSAPLQVQSGRSADGRFSNATLIEYRKYQVHFKEWCLRKRHTDGDNVTKDKLLAYAKELTAREAYEDEANPHLSIRPIFGNYGVNRHGRISPISMRKRLNAIQFLHREQCQQKGLVSNLGQEVKRAVGALLQKYRELPEEIFAPKASPAKKKSNIGRYSSIKSKVPATRSEKGSGTALSSTRKSRVTHSLSSAATAAGAVSRRGTKASRPKGASATNAKPTTSKSAPDISSNPASSPTSKPASAINSNPTSAPISRPTPTSTSAPTNSAFIPRPAPAHTLRTTPAFVSASPASATISKLTTSSTASKPTSASAPISTSTSIPTSSSGCKTVAVFSGSGSTTTLPSALHSDSAALLTPPAPSSALKSGSNSNPTNWASNLTLNVASNSAGNSKHTLASAPSHNVSAPMSTPASTPMSAPVSAPASSPLTSKSTLTQINYQGTKAGQVPVANAKPDSASGVAVDTRDMSVPAADNAPPYVAPNAKTLLRHRAHQVLWNEWCVRKKCEDGDLVTSEKLIKYTMELTSETPFEDRDSPHLSIRPLLCKAKPGMERIRASRRTLGQYMTSVRALHKEQCHKNGSIPSKEILAGRRITNILQDYENLLKRDSGKMTGVSFRGAHSQSRSDDDDACDDLSGELSDVQSDIQSENLGYQNDDHDDTQAFQEGLEDQEEQEEQEQQERQEKQYETERVGNRAGTALVGLKKSMQALWTTAWRSPSMHIWRTAHQHRLRLALDYLTDFKHNLSKVLPTHLHLVHVWSENNNNQTMFTTGIAITNTIRNEQADHEQYSIFLREREVEMCPVGALAFFLLALWTDKSTLPDFHTEDWLSTTFVSMKSSPRTLYGASMHGLPTKLFSESESGSSPDALDSSFNSSPLHRLTPLFLSTAQRLGSYMLTASFSDNAAFQLPRNRVLPPAELQRQLFPFIEDYFPASDDWRIWIENIMMDRPLDTSRPEKNRSYYRAKDFHAIRLMRVLARLRKVILQDLAAMMIYEGDDGECQFRAEYESAVQHPVFTTPAFRTFARELFDAMRADVSSSPRSATVRDDSTDVLVLDLQVHDIVEKAMAQEQTSASIEKALTSRPAHQWRYDIQALLSSRPHSPGFMGAQVAYRQDVAASIQPELDNFDTTEMAPEQERMESPYREEQLENEFSRLPSPSYALPAVSNQDSSRDDLDVVQREKNARKDDGVFMEHESTDLFKDNQVDHHGLEDLDFMATDAPEACDDTRIQEQGSMERKLERSESPSMDTAQPPIVNTEFQDDPARHEHSCLGPLTNDLARVSIKAKGHRQHNANNNNNNSNSEQLRQVVQALTARIASLEQEKKQRLEVARRPGLQYVLLPTPEPPSATSTQFSVDTVFQDENSNRTTAITTDEVGDHRQENQALRDKLAYLEQENKALAERSLQLRCQDQSHEETRPTIATTTASALIHPDSATMVRLHDDKASRQGAIMDADEDPEGLQQEILDLRAQLAARTQEKSTSLDYTMMSIEAAKFLDTTMVQMEQSMHGLWTMMANREVARFSTVPTKRPGQRQQSQQQHQKQQQQQLKDRHHRLRLRVDAMRRRIASNGFYRS